jgi:predicted nucleotidyltransferase
MHEEILKKVKQTVLKREPSAEVILFGSRARNDYGRFSDGDFLVLVDGEIDTARVDRIRHSLYEIEWDTGEVLSTIVKNRQLWNSPCYRTILFRKSVDNEGVWR